jgi:hypothetical protein
MNETAKHTHPAGWYIPVFAHFDTCLPTNVVPNFILFKKQLWSLHVLDHPHKTDKLLVYYIVKHN